MKRSTASITFLVPAYNAKETIEETLNSIVIQTSSQSFQIIVIDDGSTDGTADRVKQWMQRVKLPKRINMQLTVQAHGGEAAAINRGLQEAKGKYIAWVESDVVLDREWLKHVLSELQAESVMGAGGMLFPVPKDAWLARVMGLEISFKMLLDRNPVRHITSANALYKAKIFQQVGLCRVELGASSFDSELNHRIVSAGYDLHRNPKARAWHRYKATFWGCMERSFWYGFRRPYVQSQVLYRADALVGSLVLLTLLGWLLLPMVFFFPMGVLFFFGVLILLHFIYGWYLYIFFRSMPLLFSGIIFFLRNMVFSAAYVIGLVGKIFFSQSSAV